MMSIVAMISELMLRKSTLVDAYTINQFQMRDSIAHVMCPLIAFDRNESRRITFKNDVS